ncbi:hypothetical protein, partial [Rhizobium leguminosarum]|uniref:hypothetical protein n=1 Tax=Rhizobium leguminosarum TaxID=384 RepID=UPI003F9CF021
EPCYMGHSIQLRVEPAIHWIEIKPLIRAGDNGCCRPLERMSGLSRGKPLGDRRLADTPGRLYFQWIAGSTRNDCVETI